MLKLDCNSFMLLNIPYNSNGHKLLRLETLRLESDLNLGTSEKKAAYIIIATAGQKINEPALRLQRFSNSASLCRFPHVW
jgi:hypothetical protein